MKQICILLITLLFCCSWQRGSGQSITHVRFNHFGQDIQVDYRLNRLPFDSNVLLNLYVSTNGGISFSGPLVHVLRDVGTITTNGEKTILWQKSVEMPNLSGDVIFKVDGEVVKKDMKVENLLMYNASGSSYAGLMYGRIKRRWGGYLRAKTDFSFSNADYECTDEGVFNYQNDDAYYVVNKKVNRSRFGLTGGVLYRTGYSFYLYAGAGYGFRRLMWQADTYLYENNTPHGSIWAVNTNHSAEGIEVEVGGIFRYKNIGFSAGINTINMDFVEVNGAIGFFF